MALHLITGHAGYSHITSSDAAALLRGLAGNDTRTLGRTPSVTMSDANTLVIEPFDLIFQGRFVRSTATETVKIESGGQDAYRHDLICLRYSTDDGGTEGVELVAIKGTAAANAGAASDPVPPNVGGDSAAGAPVDIPIVRVSLDGLAPAAVWLPSALRPVESGTVLWDKGAAGWVMDAGKTIDLGMDVSTCPTGIVMLWSPYESGNVRDYWFNSVFVSKATIQALNGAGLVIKLAAVNGDASEKYPCVKYCYMHPNSIRGSNTNNVGNANNWVLRKVIAV